VGGWRRVSRVGSGEVMHVKDAPDTYTSADPCHGLR
jgi:hypothetical protein